MLSLLIDSAARSLLLGLAVRTLLKLTRLCDTRTETAVWTAVLIAALSMPLLSRCMPGLVLPAPHLTAYQTSPQGHYPSDLTLSWLARHAHVCLLGIYAAGLSVCSMRIVIGLLLSLRLYRRAAPLQADWAKTRNIRVSTEIKGPVSVAGAILLPADHDAWSPAKRVAVLAHEEAHIARGDFFIQLAALIHCALFWFSPFAWWLQSKLAEIAENASDEAAILRLDDRATYAEILIEVSRSAQKTPLLVGMAKGPFIQQRVEHILSDAPSRNLSLPLRVLVIVALTGLALAVAGAKTIGSPARPVVQAPVVTPPAKTRLRTPNARRVASLPAAATVRAARQIHQAVNIAPTHGEDITYNPRALLDPVYAPRPKYVPASSIAHAGTVFYIRSTERAVAEFPPAMAAQ